MIGAKALGSTAAARFSVLLLLLSSGCMEPFASDGGNLLMQEAGLQMAVLRATADSVDIEARWSAAAS